MTLFLFLFILFLHDSLVFHSQLSSKQILCSPGHSLFSTMFVVLLQGFIAARKQTALSDSIL